MSTFRGKYLKYANAESIEPSLNKDFKSLYLKYKMKYVQLKNQLGGKCVCGPTESNVNCPKCSKLEAGPEPASSSADMSNPVFVAASQPASSSAAMSHSEFVTALRAASASSSAITSNPEAAASSSAAGNPDMINIVVLPMTGNAGQLVFNNINSNMTIMELKQLIERTREDLPVANQRIIYRDPQLETPSLDPLDDDRRLVDYGINNYVYNPVELDLLLVVQPFKGIHAKIKQLNKDRNTEGLIKLLSQGEGELAYTEYMHVDISPLCNALKQNKTVTSFKLIQYNIFSAAADAVVDMLSENDTITSITFRAEQITTEAAIAIANMLKGNTRLTNVGLHRINFNNGAATLLAEALRHNTTLTHVDLRSIRISDAEGIELCNALRDNNNTRIIYINLSLNRIGLSDASRVALQNLRTAKPDITIIV